MPTTKIPDAYADICAVCSTYQRFEFRDSHSIRESYRCLICKGSLREREQARAILSIFGNSESMSLSELALHKDFIDKVIWEPGVTGPFRSYLKKLPNYYRSDFYNQADKILESLPHQNLEELSYQNNIFDLVITSDILEHVSNPKLAFHEIARVLKLNGYHIFTVPMQDPIPGHTIVRASFKNGQLIRYHPDRFHGDGHGGRSLVYSEFGYDILDGLSEAGFTTILLRPNTTSSIANKSLTIISQKIIAA